MSLMSNIAIKYVVSSNARVCDVCAQTFVAHVRCAWYCRDQVGRWSGDGETQEGEQSGHVVQGQAQRYRICGSRVYPHATHMDALA